MPHISSHNISVASFNPDHPGVKVLDWDKKREAEIGREAYNKEMRDQGFIFSGNQWMRAYRDGEMQADRDKLLHQQALERDKAQLENKRADDRARNLQRREDVLGALRANRERTARKDALFSAGRYDEASKIATATEGERAAFRDALLQTYTGDKASPSLTDTLSYEQAARDRFTYKDHKKADREDLTERQKLEVDRINNLIVQAQSDASLTESERATVLRNLNAAKYGIQPIPGAVASPQEAFDSSIVTDAKTGRRYIRRGNSFELLDEDNSPIAQLGRYEKAAAAAAWRFTTKDDKTGQDVVDRNALDSYLKSLGISPPSATSAPIPGSTPAPIPGSASAPATDGKVSVNIRGKQVEGSPQQVMDSTWGVKKQKPATMMA